MDLLLKNKIALVTGSTRGIGKAIAKSLHKEGCRVIINGRNESLLKNVERELGKVDSYVADVTKQKSCKKLIDYIYKKYAKLDILVCNVGCSTSLPPGKETFEEWQKMLVNNFFSTTNIIQTARKQLSKTKGVVVCVSSIAGLEVTGAPITYSVSKAALNTFVKQISHPFANEGIRINAVVPGNIMFKGSVWDKKMKNNPSKVKKMIAKEVPLCRFGSPEEVADLVTFLTSPRTEFITGSIFVIDGGQTKAL